MSLTSFHYLDILNSSVWLIRATSTISNVSQFATTRGCENHENKVEDCRNNAQNSKRHIRAVCNVNRGVTTIVGVAIVVRSDGFFSIQEKNKVKSQRRCKLKATENWSSDEEVLDMHPSNFVSENDERKTRWHLLMIEGVTVCTAAHT